MEFPPSFISRIRSQLGSDTDAFFNALQQEPVFAIRINPGKHISFGDEAVPWCSNGYYLRSRPSFTLDPLFHAGCYYVQDASSMFLEQVFDQLKLREKNILVLDACAAPGGKSTHLSSLMNGDSFLVSNETIASRLPVLKENIIKWGMPNVMITNNDPADFSTIGNVFDVILVDAPCSGEGLFRKDHNALSEWSESACELNAARQERILSSLLPSLKSGGILIYSTCTFNPAENEKQISWLVNNHEMEIVKLQINKEWGIKPIHVDTGYGYGFYPHLVKGEGLFIAVLRKKDSGVASHMKRIKTKRFVPAGKKSEALKTWINAENYSLWNKDERVFAFHNDWIDQVEFLSSRLKTILYGGCIAELKGHKPIPVHELAVSTLLNRSSFQQLEVTKEQALYYLRKEDFKVEGLKNGYALVVYEQSPLGFINFLGNRFNNYYPLNWRIRKQLN